MKQSRNAPSINSIYEREHFSQFYQDDARLLASLRSFVGGGLKAGEKCIVIATPEHRRALDTMLAEDIAAGSPLQMSGYQAFDAEETLARFMNGNLPDRAKFMELVGGLYQDMGEDTKAVRAFGEMVALLWAAGNQSGAILLEQLWNEAMRKYSMTLFCAYPAYHFSEQAHLDSMTAIKQLHSSFILPSVW